ncbi:DEAD/DEAH box helicase [Helicobacter mustelae]|uniref:DEAD box helicase family protein n=1 Tax=Helicobacter mustelae (strain ATCC 43772 / CCUG 25715 / CIP 103759 / LMG 18044 / NCTC 12198 / R85-136P) TaxID=679897 RepID=D3UJ82_HELM1|nr:DEAD/DEAH box helicase [Helicobacter mustelae]CBG40557.1 DEAD box helicase family protein [Helicobacter mustelae 12198]SQH72054.1 DEAD box helicase [Helicobacter mustelae]
MTKNNKKNNMTGVLDAEGFENLGLSKTVLKGVLDAGFRMPTPIQEQAIPAILQERDVIAQAQTGTGKTAAFTLPILEMLHHNQSIEALIITPTRELTMQVSDEIYKLGRPKNIKTVCVYGGQSIKRQCELLAKNPQIMVATPGRLLDHLKSGRLDNFTPRFVVLDESDEMLDMGFLDDIEEIFNYLPNNIQVLLFSATMPEAIKKLAQRILHNPIHIKITPTANMTNLDVTQYYCVIGEGERQEALMRILDTENIYKSIIFTRTKKEADGLYNFLEARGYKAGTLHGDMEQRDRRAAILDFKKCHYKILVATDVASRGLDISDVSHVFNYHIPTNSEVYVHRIGRTGRAGKKGKAITFVTPLEFKDLKKIQEDVGSKLEIYEIPHMPQSPKTFVNKVLQTKIHNSALEILESLKEYLDSTQIILKLLSMQMEGQSIGLSKEDIEKMHRDITKQGKESREEKEGKKRKKRKKRGKGEKEGREGKEEPRGKKPREEKNSQERRQKSANSQTKKAK